MTTEATNPRPWWHADRHADRRPRLLARQRILQAIRSAFDADGFLEVDPGQLQLSPGNETHLHAFATRQLDAAGEAVSQLYLHTSPEFAMKKLLAAGEMRIFSLVHAFRNRERSVLHHPEFTLLEWYRAGQDYSVLMDDCAALLATAAEVAGTGRLEWQGVTIDPSAEIERLSVAEAFERHAGIDILALSARDALAEAAYARGVRTAADDSWSDIFTRIMLERIEPHLGIERPTILLEYPISEAALARPKPGDPRVAERFELYCCGVELANAFGELIDPIEQRRRFEADMALKQQLYGERYPIDDELIAALSHMPLASGAALGLDRLVMLATGARSIDEVIWAPLPP